MASTKPETSNKSKSILIVDDDGYFRQLMVEVLKPLGFNILEASTVKDGTKLAFDNDLALAVIDYRLPDGDGDAIISRLRESNNTVPIVFVSAGWCDPKTFKWLRNNLKVSLILQKPIQPELFIQQIDPLLPDHSSETTVVDPETTKRSQIEYYAQILLRFAGLDANVEETVSALEQISIEHSSATQQMAALMLELNENLRETEKSLKAGIPRRSTNDTSSGMKPTVSPKPITEINPIAHVGTNAKAKAEPKAEPVDDTDAVFGVFGGTGDQSHEVELLRQLRQLRRKLEVETQIQKAQVELRKDFPQEWSKLSESLKLFNSNPTIKERKVEAIHLAHRVRGSAGSLGLSRASACAGRIERLLRKLDSDAAVVTQEEQEIWSEVFRELLDGESGIESLEKVELGELRFNVGKVLVVTDHATMKEAIQKLSPFDDVDFVITTTVMDAMIKASSTHFDATIIDMGLVGKDIAFNLAKEIRSTMGNDAIPLLFIAPYHIERSELLFAGASVTLGLPVDQMKFEDGLSKLVEASKFKHPRILAVDDDVVLTKFIDTILTGQGLHVSVLNEPIRIMEVLDEVQPDVVLLDVSMPGLSGYDVCRMLREHQTWGTLPIIFLTADIDAQGRAAAFQAGGNEFLSKPVLSEELINRVNTQVERSRLQRGQTTLDELSGVLKKEVYSRRTRDAFTQAKSKQRNISVCLLSIDNYEELERHSPFAACSVVSSFGKLLRARLKAEVLRGRWGNGFALTLVDEEKKNVEDALKLLVGEFKQINFTDTSGARFDVAISWATASFPKDGGSFSEIIEKAESTLLAEVNRMRGVAVSS